MLDNIINGAQKVFSMAEGETATQGEVQGAAIVGLVAGMAIQGYRHNEQVESGDVKPFKAFLI